MGNARLHVTHDRNHACKKSSEIQGLALVYGLWEYGKMQRMPEIDSG